MEFKEWLGDNELSYTIWNNKYRVNNESLDEWFDRVSNRNPYLLVEPYLIEALTEVVIVIVILVDLFKIAYKIF